jgi:EAL domain-containing protein (putative c-di-GMP-specific phosphodiesterase class I)
MGVTIAVDDFGSGNANYSALLKFEPDIVKLDHSIVEAARRSDRGRRLLSSAISAAQSVGALIIAEGVVDETTSFEMQRLGVHYVQGNRLALPLRIGEILTLP